MPTTNRPIWRANSGCFEQQRIRSVDVRVAGASLPARSPAATFGERQSGCTDPNASRDVSSARPVRLARLALMVRDEEASLPNESLMVPLARVLNVRFRGSWLRPRLELSGRDLAVFETVPGEDGGIARLWISRRDRENAEALAKRINQAIGELE